MLVYYITYLSSTASPEPHLSTMSWVITKLLHCSGALFYLLAGGFITFAYQALSKYRENRSISLNNSHHISLILCKERASLQGIYDFLKERDGKPHQKSFIRPTILSINQESVEKILLHKKFYKFNYAHPIQALVVAEQAYRNCFELVNEYNKTIDKLLKVQASPKRAGMVKLEHGYSTEIISHVENIKRSYQEAVELNEKAQSKLDELCKKVFENSYRPSIPDHIVKATEL